MLQLLQRVRDSELFFLIALFAVVFSVGAALSLAL